MVAGVMEQIALGDDHRAENHDFADDDIGSLLIITAASIVGSSERTDEANALLEYLLSAPVQEYFSNETFEYPLVPGVAASVDLPSLDGFTTPQADYGEVSAALEMALEKIAASGLLEN